MEYVETIIYKFKSGEVKKMYDQTYLPEEMRGEILIYGDLSILPEGTAIHMPREEKDSADINKLNKEMIKQQKMEKKEKKANTEEKILKREARKARKDKRDLRDAKRRGD